MTQEVQVTLKLDVDASQNKKDIEKFINGLINTHTLRSSTHNRLIYSDIQIKEIKEEAEIYDVEGLLREEVAQKHSKLREVLISYGNEEFGDCIIDEISWLFGYPTTNDTGL